MSRITTTVRELRKRLDESQDAFAKRLGLSVRAIANYETDRTPTLTGLVALMKLADAQGSRDLGTIFQRVIEKELGHPVMRIATSKTVQLADGEEEDVSALLCILRYEGATYKDLRVKWDALVEPVKVANRASDFRASMTLGIMQMLQEGLAAGLTDEQIMAKAPKADQIALQAMLTMARGMQKLETKRKAGN